MGDFPSREGRTLAVLLLPKKLISSSVILPTVFQSSGWSRDPWLGPGLPFSRGNTQQGAGLAVS